MRRPDMHVKGQEYELFRVDRVAGLALPSQGTVHVNAVDHRRARECIQMVSSRGPAHPRCGHERGVCNALPRAKMLLLHARPRLDAHCVSGVA